MDAMVNNYTIPNIDVARNAFDKSHRWLGDISVGLLYPVFFDEVLPGDTKELKTTFFGRINPTVTAPFDNVWLDYHLFFVPNRLDWEHWSAFLGEKVNPNDSTDYLVPTIKAGADGFARNGLLDYFTVPPGVPKLSASSLVFYLRAYNKIWNEWYRDIKYQDEVTVPLGDTGDSESIYNLLPRGKRQDYFTSCFATPQSGAGANIPIGSITGQIPVVGTGYALGLNPNGMRYSTGSLIDWNSPTTSGKLPYLSIGYSFRTASGVSNPSISDLTVGVNDNKSIGDSGNGLFAIDNQSLGSTQYTYNIGVSTTPSQSGLQTIDAGPYLTLSPVSINTFRSAIALQQFAERDMLGGQRLVEIILSHFGVRVPDYRLQRPEYLGGTTTRININPVTQLSSTDSTSPQGNISGNGVMSGEGEMVHSFTEHGVVIGLVSLRTDQTYQQGVDRLFLRNSRYDYFWQTLSHLGMQATYNKEIYAQGDDIKDSDDNIVDNKPFGYNLRYNEYRFKNSYVTGTLRSSHPQSLDIWHFSENFENLPTLSSDFIEVSDTLNRIMTVQTEPEVILDVYHDYTDVKVVPMYGTPGLERV